MADLTDSSSSSTFLRSDELNSNSSSLSSITSSSGSSKLIKGLSWSIKILAEKASASSGLTEPSVSIDRDNLS